MLLRISFSSSLVYVWELSMFSLFFLKVENVLRKEAAMLPPLEGFESI